MVTKLGRSASASRNVLLNYQGLHVIHTLTSSILYHFSYLGYIQLQFLSYWPITLLSQRCLSFSHLTIYIHTSLTSAVNNHRFAIDKLDSALFYETTNFLEAGAFALDIIVSNHKLLSEHPPTCNFAVP